MPAAFFCTLLKLSYARTYIQMLSTTAHQRVSWCVALIVMAVTIWLLERNILEGMCVYFGLGGNLLWACSMCVYMCTDMELTNCSKSVELISSCIRQTARKD